MTRMRSIVVASLIGLLLFASSPKIMAGCCVGTTGNVDGDPANIIDISDIQAMVDYLVSSLPLSPCFAANDVNQDGTIDISDLQALIDFLVYSLPLPACPVDSLTYAQRSAVFQAADSLITALETKPADSAALVLAAFLAKRPEIDSAGVVDSSSVWAWFKDGRIWSIPNNRPSAPGTGPSGDYAVPVLETHLPNGFIIPPRRFPAVLDPTAIVAPPVVSVQATTSELPQSLQAHILTTLSAPCFNPGAATVRNLLNNNGYVVVPATGSVSSLLGITGDGIFYIDAHGGRCKAKNSATYYLAVWTASVRSPANDSAFTSMLNNAELVYMTARDLDPGTGTCHTHERYAFTGRFVAQYMNFAHQSLIFINACHSDTDPLFRQGFFTAGASVYCGWTKSVGDPAADLAAEFLFDRMLGANASTLTPVESPPQRPFDILPLWQDMQNRGYDTDHRTGAKFRVEQLQANFALLSPSIEFITVDEYYDSLTVAGMFGSDPGSHGRVLVGGTELPITHWESQYVRAVIPNSGAGSVGPVHVEVDGLTGGSSSIKRKSNEVNLSEWRDTVTYDVKWADGSMADTIKLHLHFRDDIHPFRDVPHLPPNKTIVVFDCVQDADGASKSGGSYTYNGIPGDPWTWTENGGCTIPGLWNHNPAGTFFALGGFNTNTLSVEMHLNASTVNCGTMSLHSNSISTTQPISPSIDPHIFEDGKDLLHLTFDKDWNISAKDTTATDCCQQFVGTPATFPIHLKISRAMISFPPDSTKGQ